MRIQIFCSLGFAERSLAGGRAAHTGSSRTAGWDPPLPLVPTGARLLCHRTLWGIPPRSIARAMLAAAHTSSHVCWRFCRADLHYRNQITALHGLREALRWMGATKGGAPSCSSRGIHSLTRQLSSQMPFCSPATPAPLTSTARAMGRQLEPCCTPDQAWHIPAPLLPVPAHGWSSQLHAQPFCSGNVVPGTQRADTASSSSFYPEHLTMAANRGRWAHVRMQQPGVSTFSWASLLLAAWWRRFFPVRPPHSSHLPTCPCAGSACSPPAVLPALLSTALPAEGSAPMPCWRPGPGERGGLER